MLLKIIIYNYYYYLNLCIIINNIYIILLNFNIFNFSNNYLILFLLLGAI